jgi:DNA-binding CsgD family transcriptional regulator
MHDLDLMEAPDRAGWRPLRRPWGLYVGLASLLVAAAMVTNWADGAHPAHVAVEVTAMLVLAILAVAVLRHGQRATHLLRRQVADMRARVARSHDELARMRAESERWRQAVEGVGDVIDQQLTRWDLTPAEREVALLLLKGLSLKEIAGVRSTSERTARDQARAIYAKAGVTGRSELSAFFLEDLLVPVGDRG